MFDKYRMIFVNENNSVDDSSIISETLKSISDNEIESKNRVDITLKEYLELTRELDKLKIRCQQMESFIIRLSIPSETIEKIDLDSIEVATCEQPKLMKQRYRIEFVADIY